MACVPDGGPERRSTVVYASGADLQSINPLVTVHPLAKAVQNHVLFLTLATYDSSLQPIPRLAAWRWSSGRRVLELDLRRDVRWHDGVRTTASDVVWTLGMARRPEVAYPRAADLRSVRAVTALDSFTVRLEFERGQPVFPDVLTDLAILPSHLLDSVAPADIRTAPFNATPVGNGPFRFIEYRPKQRWVFERDTLFPEELGQPAIERFVVAVVDEPATKLAALTSGELDFAGVSPAHAEYVANDPELAAVDYPILLSYALVWNLRRTPFDRLEVRRALTMALDRQYMIDAVLYGFGTPADGPVPPEHPWYEPVAPVPFDTIAANRLLNDAGWQVGPDGIRRHDGRRLEFQLLTVGSGTNALEQLIQAQLRRIGVAVTIRQLELTSFLATAQGSARDFDALVTGIPGDLALNYVGAMFDGRSSGPLAYAGYRSQEFDAQLDRIEQAPSADALRAGWARAQQVLGRDIPTTWLYHARGLQGVSRRIHAPPPDLRGELATVATWTVSEEGRRR